MLQNWEMLEESFETKTTVKKDKTQIIQIRVTPEI